MSGDKSWGQALLIGGGIVAAAGIVYYLYSSSSTPQQQDDDFTDRDDRVEEIERDEQPSQESKDDSASEPLKNRLPPLPERPSVGSRRKAASTKPSSASTSSKDDSKEAKPSGQTHSTKSEMPSTAAADKANPHTESPSNGAAVRKDDTAADSGDEDNVLDWSETPDEVIILLAVPASAQKHEVNYKLRPTHLTVSVQGVQLIQANLSNSVQPEDSTWQFDFFQGMRVMSITLQKAANGSPPADWDKLFLK